MLPQQEPSEEDMQWVQKQETKYDQERKEKLKTESYFNVEEYSEDLRDVSSGECLTPKTRFFKLSLDEGAAIVHKYQQESLNHKEKFTAHDEAVLSELEEKISQFLNQHFPDQKAFCRLSTRSPKDASLFSGSLCFENTKRSIKKQWLESFRKQKGRESPCEFIYKEEVDEFEQFVQHLGHANEYLTFMKASQQALSVSNAKEAIDILTHSERVLRDLVFALDYPSMFNMKLIFREWCPELVYEYEFRGFVHNFELIALCQYDNTCTVQELNEYKDEIGQTILNYYNLHVKPVLVKYAAVETSSISKWNGEVIMDFAILQPSKKVIVVECNPFNAGTGASLFELDRDTIKEKYDKDGQFEFRIVTPDMYKEYLENGTHVWESIFGSTRDEIVHEIVQLAQERKGFFCVLV